MKKQEMVQYISNNYEWFQCMQVGLGHHSWWYTNRTPEECINVKLHAWVDTDKLLERLTREEIKTIETLGIDVNKWCNDYVWDDYGLVENERDFLLEELKEEYNVTNVEYGGNSGGWLAVIYEWDDVPEDFEDEYSYQEVKQFYTIIQKALNEHERVTAFVQTRKKQLELAIEDIETYLEPLQEFLIERLENEQEKASEVLSLSL